MQDTILFVYYKTNIVYYSQSQNGNRKLGASLVFKMENRFNNLSLSDVDLSNNESIDREMLSSLYLTYKRLSLSKTNKNAL